MGMKTKLLSFYCKYTLLLMYFWAVCSVFINVKIINEAKFSPLDLEMLRCCELFSDGDGKK